MAPPAGRIPCYYCKDEEPPVPLYDSRSFTAHILEKHLDQVILRDPVDAMFGDSFGLATLLFVEREDVDYADLFGDSFGLATLLFVEREDVDYADLFGDSFELSTLLFLEDEDDSDPPVDDEDDADPAGTIPCDLCPLTFHDLSSSTNHLRIVHPDLFYPLCAHVASSAPAPAPASSPLAVEPAGLPVVSSAGQASGLGSASAGLHVESSAGQASGSGSASASAGQASGSGSASVEVSEDSNKEWCDSFMWSFGL